MDRQYQDMVEKIREAQKEKDYEREQRILTFYD